MVNSFYYQVNSQQVAYEVLEGEVVIIHLDKGNYYNLEGSCLEIWNLLVAGVKETDLLESVFKNYDVSSDVAKEAVQNFLDQLKAEELITTESGEPAKIDSVADEKTAKSPFQPPSIQKYEDMQDLLLLDPLHDVDETMGWPARKQ